MTEKCLIGHQQMPINANTPAALSRVYLEEPSHTSFLDQQSLQRHFLHLLQGFFKDLSQKENLVRGAATWMKTILAVFQLTLIRLNSRHFVSRHLAYTFPGRLRSDDSR